MVNLKEVQAKLAEKIKETKKETDAKQKEILFIEVMQLAWEEVDGIRERDPCIMMHPREYLYRDLCGFDIKKENDE